MSHELSADMSHQLYVHVCHELSADMNHLCIYVSVTNCVYTLVAGSYGTPGSSRYELSADMNHLLYTYVRHELCGYTCCWLPWGTRSIESSSVLISCVCVLQCVAVYVAVCFAVCCSLRCRVGYQLHADAHHKKYVHVRFDMCENVYVTNCVDSLVVGSYWTPGPSNHEFSADTSHLLYIHVRHELCSYICGWLLWDTKLNLSSLELFADVSHELYVHVRHDQLYVHVRHDVHVHIVGRDVHVHIVRNSCLQIVGNSTF